jgi:antitoxin HigA-1
VTAEVNIRSELTISGEFVLFGGMDTALTSKLWTITERIFMSKRGKLMDPVHPGEILREDFLKPLGLTVNKLALELHVPATRVGEIVHGRRRVTADTALRLARYFKTNPEFWLNLQNFYDLEISRRSEAGSKIEVQVQPVGEMAAK